MTDVHHYCDMIVKGLIQYFGNDLSKIVYIYARPEMFQCTNNKYNVDSECESFFIYDNKNLVLLSSTRGVRLAMYSRPAYHGGDSSYVVVNPWKTYGYIDGCTRVRLADFIETHNRCFSTCKNKCKNNREEYIRCMTWNLFIRYCKPTRYKSLFINKNDNTINDSINDSIIGTKCIYIDCDSYSAQHIECTIISHVTNYKGIYYVLENSDGQKIDAYAHELFVFCTVHIK